MTLVMKDYDHSCDYCLVPWDSLPTDFAHCRYCHETFADSDLMALHKHPLTGGCRFPGNLERFYETDFHAAKVWYQKPDPNVKEDEKV